MVESLLGRIRSVLKIAIQSFMNQNEGRQIPRVDVCMLEDRVLFSASPLAGAFEGADMGGDLALDAMDGPFGMIFDEDYSGPAANGHEIQSGQAEIDDGRYRVTPNGEATSLSTLRTETPLSDNLELSVLFNADDISPQHFSNAFVIFDFQSLTDFKFVGAHVGVDEWVVGHVDTNGFHFDEIVNAQIDALTDYQLKVTIVNDSTITLYADGMSQLTRSYGESITDGQLGLGTRNANSRFDDLSVRALPADTDSSAGAVPLNEDFDDGKADHLSPTAGTWLLVDGTYQVSPEINGDGISLANLTEDLSDSAEIGVTINVDETLVDRFGNGFIIFDYQNENDFKYAGGYIARDEWAIGHRTSEGWIDDVVVSTSLDAFTDHEMRLVFKNATEVSFFHGETEVASHMFADDITDGSVGLASHNSVTRFDNFSVVDPVVESEVTAVLDGERLVIGGHSDGLIEIVAVENDVFQILDRGRLVSTVEGVTDDLRIDLGETSDRVRLDLGGHMFYQNVFVDVGEGDDSIEIVNGSIGGHLIVRTGSGNDSVTISEDVYVKKHARINTGSGDDDFTFQGTSARKVFVRTGGGDDSLQISGSINTGLFAKTGRGDDTIDFLGEADLGRHVRLDLGRGTDTYSFETSTYQNVLIRDERDCIRFTGPSLEDDDRSEETEKRDWKTKHTKVATEWKTKMFQKRGRF